jgi:hypothetical protein
MSKTGYKTTSPITVLSVANNNPKNKIVMFVNNVNLTSSDHIKKISWDNVNLGISVRTCS